MTIIERIKRSINRRKGEVVLTRDFASFGSRSTVAAALKALVGQGFLYRIGQGVYAKTMPSILTGKGIPRQPLGGLAAEAFERLGIKFELGFAQRKYMNGETTQIPAHCAFEVFDRRISRKLRLGRGEVKYENNRRD